MAFVVYFSFLLVVRQSLDKYKTCFAFISAVMTHENLVTSTMAFLQEHSQWLEFKDLLQFFIFFW